MKEVTKYAYLIKHESLSPEKNGTELASKDFSAEIIGVPNVEKAISTIKFLTEQTGIQLVGLCGAFTKEETDQIRKEVPNMPIERAELGKKNRELLRSNLETQEK